MPGGDLAAKYPLRMLLGILSKIYSQSELHKMFNEVSKIALPHGATELKIALAQIYQDINIPLTTSTGRVLDSLAALLGVTYHRSYEGEPAIRFESYANSGSRPTKLRLNIPIKQVGNSSILVTSALIDQVLQLQEKFRGPDLAFCTHHALAKALAKVAIGAANKHELDKIGFSGGVAYNKILTKIIRHTIEEEGLTFLIHHHVPPGDAGTAVGQSLVARSQIQ